MQTPGGDCAKAYFHQDKSQKALADIEAAIRLNPDEADSFYVRGRIHADRSDWRLAIADYSEAIRLDPQFGWAYARRAAAYEAIDAADEAAADRAKAKELGPHGGRKF